MIVKFFGFLDLFTALILLLFHFGAIHNPLVLSLAFYLISKAVIFFGNTFSILDGLIGVYMIFMIVYGGFWLTFVLAAYLVIKGFISLM